MPRNIGAAVDSTFVKGLITEATGLNFPQDACTETENCRFNQLGSVTRREGLDFETDYVTNAVIRTDSVISEYVWNAVAGTGTINLAVIQIGSHLYFYQVSETGSLSPALKAFTVNLNDYRVSGASNTKKVAAQFTAGKGFLFVSHRHCDPFYIEYSQDTDDITVTRITIKTRDFEGVVDGLRDEERPTDLTTLHKYNLFNQGWYAAVDVNRDGPGALEDPINYFKFGYRKAPYNAYPSNCDIWWLYKDELEAFSPSLTAGEIAFGNTPAPKGHFILDEFYKDRSAATELDCTSNIPDLDVVSAGNQRPVTISFYAGRVWYAGVAAPKYSSRVYYSQIIDKIEKVGFCYQSQDPTSEQDSDLLDSDGGVIDILEIGTIIKLFPIKDALIVFASNGTWSISGTSNSGFNATDFQINKLSSVPSVSSSSFIDVLGTPLWWNYDGIYTIGYNQVNIPEVKSITDQTIKTFFEDIPNNAKKFAKGAYNQLTKEIQWCYTHSDPSVQGFSDSSSASSVSSAYDYDRILCLNTLTGAFYGWTVDANIVKLTGILSTQGTGSSFTDEAVTDTGGNTVLDSLGNIVTTPVLFQTELSGTFKYLVNYNDGVSQFTFAEETDGAFQDWGTFTSGLDYESYLVTGYRLRGNALSYGQIPYIVVYTKTQDDASLLVSVIWDYASNTNTNRWGRLNQCYPALSDYGIQQRRIKLRGKGRALQLKYQSESGKPFNLQGWSTMEAVNAQP